MKPSELIASTASVGIGRFRCPIGHRRFSRRARTGGYLLVFPRTAVEIAQEGARPVVADRNVVMFYNHLQAYERRAISPRGDHSDWLAYPPDVVASAAASYAPAGGVAAERPLEHVCGPVDAGVYLLQRKLHLHAGRASQPDLFVLEDAALEVLDRVLAAAYRDKPGAVPGKRLREQVEAVRRRLARDYREAPGLVELAAAVGLSSFHLSRSFKRLTGLSLRAYRDELRLRAALEALAGGCDNLAALACDLGYASHSHFTQAFHARFGLPPSTCKSRLLAAQVFDSVRLPVHF